MGKLILLILFGVLAYLYLTRSRRKVPPAHPEPPRAAEAMVRCARCGVYLPSGEALAASGKHYCSEEHRRLG